MLKIGILGCGQITKVRHAPEYAENPNCQIVALFDQDIIRAEEIQKLYGGIVCHSIAEFLAQELDAVSVCVANIHHSEVTIAALKAGNHVLCEKPMAVTMKACREMVEVARATGKVLMIGQNQRYNESHRMVKRLLNDGEIGKLLGFRLVFGHSGPEGWTGVTNPWFYDKKTAHFGALADLGIHKIDLLRFITGSEITEVMAAEATVDKKYPDGKLIDVDDNAFFIMKLDNGAMGTIQASWTFYGREDNSTILYGTKGEIRVYDDPKYSIVIEKVEGQRRNIEVDIMTTNELQSSGNRITTGVIDAFVTAIMNGGQTDADGADVLKSMQAVFAAEKSIHEGRFVKIDEV